MRSVKPGRGPSLQGAIGSIFAVVFGIFWMVSAAKMEHQRHLCLWDWYLW